MNKGISTSTVGVAALLAGMMFQSRSSGTTEAGNGIDHAVLPAATSSAHSDGPWLASCNYWAAVKTVDLTKQEVEPTAAVTFAAANAGKLELQLDPSKEKADCGVGDWNIPHGEANDPEISAIIATVPDPIHSHLALDFDRSIDAMLLAAAANQYLSSYYWLPWRSQMSNAVPGADIVDATRPTEADNVRERQPGLIILRYAPDASKWSEDKGRFEWSNYRRVIYLFLVAETPALGVNGNQLQNAFAYEKWLRDSHKATLSVRASTSIESNAPEQQSGGALEMQPSDSAKQSTVSGSPPVVSLLQQSHSPGSAQAPSPQSVAAGAVKSQQTGSPEIQTQADVCRGTKLSIIGPIYSGSASSLHAGIEEAFPELHDPCISITGITGTEVAFRELDPNRGAIYRSFGEDIAFEQDRFLESLAGTGYDLSRVAVLSEAGTVFGSKRSYNFGPAPESPPARDPKAQSRPPIDLSKQGTVLYLGFPRELSLLRNAEASQAPKPDANAPPTPYLNLSLKDYAADDTVTRFSTNQSPLSIEAQLMAIAHQLQLARSQFILISASNVLDEIFLAQFLHRACPDARIVVFGRGDLLFERDTDNAPYIGSVSISSYLLSSLDFASRTQWLYADGQTEAIYNAASFTFHDTASLDPPVLAGYRNYPVPKKDEPPPVVQFQQIPLWATIIGTDGYYPLAVLNWCGSDRTAMLPTLFPRQGQPPLLKGCIETDVQTPDAGAPKRESHWDYVPDSINQNSGISPSLLWGVLACLILLAGIVHCVGLVVADFWSPPTRDLAIDQNDLPCRRSVYLHIGTAVLAAISFVTAYPLLRVGHYFHLDPGGELLAWLTLATGVSAVLCTGWKTRHYLWPRRRRIYSFFSVVAGAALFGIPVVWALICGSDGVHGDHSYAGLYFSYRCLHPFSGVCPLVPVLLLLVAWYLWAIYQTARLRFSAIHRPRIARLPAPADYSPSRNAYPLFVPDDTLETCARSTDNCLYSNISCLLISREIVRRFVATWKHDPCRNEEKITNGAHFPIDPMLWVAYVVLFGLFIFGSHVHSVDRFLFAPLPAPVFGVMFLLPSGFSGSVFHGFLQYLGHPFLTPLIFPITFDLRSGPTLYELLVTVLFFPLIMVALSGWLRVIFIWGSLSRGLLDPLERMPIRYAFTRYKGGSWFSMLRQKGLTVRWRDMARSTESIRQLAHDPELNKKPDLKKRLCDEYEIINVRIHELMESIRAAGSGVVMIPSRTVSAAGESLAEMRTLAAEREGPWPSDDFWDLPSESGQLRTILRIEQGYARFCTILIDEFLVPYWDQKRTGFVEEMDSPEEAGGERPSAGKAGEPSLIELAEELIVIRYVALIRAVLINIRYLMMFVAAAFVFALVAWNSYPFQPHAFIDWCFTILLGILTLGFLWVFAQMHRNAILSRITNTTANELGWEFWLRIAAFGAVPILTWLAYQFPEIGGSVYKLIQPGLQVVK